jgi:hypothetical protein
MWPSTARKLGLASRGAPHKMKPDAQIALPNGHFPIDHGNVPTLNSALHEGTLRACLTSM